LVNTAGVTDGPALRDAQGAVFLSYALVHVPHDRYFASLRDTPRLRALLQKLNLLT
jgi:hypothetical protein